MERGIGLFIWKHKGDFTRPDGTYFSQEEVDQLMSSLASRGIAGLKIDFMQSDRLETLTLYDRIARSALKHRLVVNFHGSTKPGGENRTYPNIVTSEAVLGSEQYKYGRPPTVRFHEKRSLFDLRKAPQSSSFNEVSGHQDRGVARLGTG